MNNKLASFIVLFLILSTMFINHLEGVYTFKFIYNCIAIFGLISIGFYYIINHFKKPKN